MKVDVNDPTGKSNKVYQSKSSIAVHEPQFIPNPGSTEEDDGVVIVRGLDVQSGKGKRFFKVEIYFLGMVIIINAKTMTEVGTAVVPISIPFGFHNRFFSMGSSGNNNPSSTTSNNHKNPTPSPNGTSRTNIMFLLYMFIVSLLFM